MRQSLSLTSGNPSAILNLPWDAEGLTVLNWTPRPVYVRIGDNQIPNINTFHYLAAPGTALSMPCANIRNFAFNMDLAQTGILAQTRVDRADIIVVKDEPIPQASQFMLDVQAVSQWDWTIGAGGSTSLVIPTISAKGLLWSTSWPNTNANCNGLTISQGQSPIGPFVPFKGYMLYTLGSIVPIQRATPILMDYTQITVEGTPGDSGIFRYALAYNPVAETAPSYHGHNRQVAATNIAPGTSFSSGRLVFSGYLETVSLYIRSINYPWYIQLILEQSGADNVCWLLSSELMEAAPEKNAQHLGRGQGCRLIGLEGDAFLFEIDIKQRIQVWYRLWFSVESICAGNIARIVGNEYTRQEV